MFAVGYYLEPSQYKILARFTSARQAMRLARRWHKALRKQGRIIDVACTRHLGGCFTDMDWFVPGCCRRQYYFGLSERWELS